MRHLQRVADRLVRREPVLFFGAIGLWITAATDLEPESAAGVALGATVLLFQRAYSTAKATAEENAAGAKYVGAVEERAAAADAGPKQVEVVQPLDQPVPVAETPRPAKKAAAKKAAARRNP